MFILHLPLALLLAGASAQDLSPTLSPDVPETQPPAADAPSPLPIYLSLWPNLNDFGQFADGGPDSNWYVGFNNAWIVQLPAAPSGDFKRAFIGARIGRAKTRPKPGRPWQREVIPGEIYMAVSPTASFSSEQSYFLAETKDVPLENDPKAYTPHTGQSEWFWAEVPTTSVNFNGPNYLIIWSRTDYFTSASSAPILAALEAGGDDAEEAHAWANRSIQGVPPRSATGALETPIRNLYPALAIKLVPPNDNPVTTEDCAASPLGRKTLFTFSVNADNADIAWVERSQDRLDWERVSRYLRHPPYAVTLAPEDLEPRGYYLRAAARDVLGNEGVCEARFVNPPK